MDEERHSSSRRRERSSERDRTDRRSSGRHSERDRDDRRPRDEYEDRSRRYRDDDRRRDDRRDDRRDRDRPRDYDDTYSRGSGGRGRHAGGGGGRSGGVRDGSPERRSPTPDGAVPLSKRQRKTSGWDVRAPGCENMTAMQAKQTGMFILPGQNRNMGASMGFAPNGMPMMRPGFPPMGMGNGPPPANVARQRRRLYVGNITPDCNEQNISELFNEKMHDLGFSKNDQGEPVLGVQLNQEKSYAFVEFRNQEEATSALVFDNVVLCNSILKLRRPKDYVPEPGADQGAPYIPGVISANVPDSVNKVFVGGLPSYLNDEQVIELLKSFGEVKAFNLVKENHDPEKSKGFAFCEYVDPAITDVAIQGLHNMELGDRFLVVQRAAVGSNGARPPPTGPSAMGFGGGANNIPIPSSFAIPAAGGGASTSRAIVMLNMVTADELVSDEDYGDIVEDIKDECSKYGQVEDLDIPRPTKVDKKWAPGDQAAVTAAEAAKKDEEAGVGKVYVLFKTIEGANAAAKAIAGRQFGGRVIIVAAQKEDEYLARKTGPAGEGV